MPPLVVPFAELPPTATLLPGLPPVMELLLFDVPPVLVALPDFPPSAVVRLCIAAPPFEGTTNVELSVPPTPALAPPWPFTGVDTVLAATPPVVGSPPVLPNPTCVFGSSPLLASPVAAEPPLSAVVTVVARLVVRVPEPPVRGTLELLAPPDVASAGPTSSPSPSGPPGHPVAAA